MAAPSTPMPISPTAQEKIVHYLSGVLTMYATSYNIRNQMVLRDLAYYRTHDVTQPQSQAKVANESGDPTKIQNVTVPVVMPQVETALADLQETFLTGYPIFGTVAPPDQAEAIAQLDTLIGENSIRGAWPLELLQVFRDGLKYDLGVVEIVWENRKIFTVTTAAVQNLEQGTPTETYYQGNFIKRLDPYNTFLDTRVSPEKNHLMGEFAGYTEMISMIETKKRMEDLSILGTMNFKEALESPGPEGPSDSDISAPFFLPTVNPDALLNVADRNQQNWMSWAGLEQSSTNNIKYRNSYEWTVLYCRVLPSVFSLPGRNKNHVQIWKFIVINRKVVIFAERQTNAHNLLPIVVCKPSADGMGWQSKSFAENAIPYQQISTGLTNSGLESQRRKVYDRLYYDPSRINKKDMDNVSSVARIPVKNSMYGKNISEAIYQSPYRDDGVAEIMSMGQNMAGMADIANGQNRVQQGQFQKGNKTRKEFDTVMSGANSRGRMRALAIEYSFMVPAKQILLSNYLQYQPPTTLLNSNTGESVEVDPAMLRKANLSMKLSDGYMPSEKLASMEMMPTIFSAAQAIPAIAAEYDIMGMFIYSMSLQGASWLKDFKRTPDQAAAYTQQMAQAAQAAGTANPPPAKAPEGPPA